jgi:hypothetical protein
MIAKKGPRSHTEIYKRRWCRLQCVPHAILLNTLVPARK